MNAVQPITNRCHIVFNRSCRHHRGEGEPNIIDVPAYVLKSAPLKEDKVISSREEPIFRDVVQRLRGAASRLTVVVPTHPRRVGEEAGTVAGTAPAPRYVSLRIFLVGPLPRWALLLAARDRACCGGGIGSGERMETEALTAAVWGRGVVRAF